MPPGSASRKDDPWRRMPILTDLPFAPQHRVVSRAMAISIPMEISEKMSELPP
jgi:hypothetical protein